MINAIGFLIGVFVGLAMWGLLKPKRSILREDLPTWWRWIFRWRKPIGPKKGYSVGRTIGPGAVMHYLDHNGNWRLPPVTSFVLWDQKEAWNQFVQRANRQEQVYICEWVRKGKRYVARPAYRAYLGNPRPNRLKRGLEWLFGW